MTCLPYQNPNKVLPFQENFNNRKTYIAFSGCLIEHVVTSKKSSNIERLYYLLVNGLAIIAKNSGKQRAFALPSKDWARLLACSKAKIFSMQASLQQKQYFIIHKSKNNYAQNNRNLITPTLPDDVFQSLSQAHNRYNSKLNNKNTSFYNPESKMDYLDRTKLFIPLNYQLLTFITSNQSISSLQKLIWLDFYCMSYKKYRSTQQYLNQNSNTIDFYDFLISDFTLTITYQELMERYSLTKHSLSKLLKDLEVKNFIKKNRNFIKINNDEHHSRLDKSLWQITPLMPSDLNIQNLDTELSLLSSNKETACNDNENSSLQLEFDFMNISQQKNESENFLKLGNDVAFCDPHIVKSELLLNKDLKIKIIKNIKSNLEEEPKVLFDNFLQENQTEINNNDYIKAKQYLENVENNKSKKYQIKKSDFNILSELVKTKLQILPKDKAEKARKFAYSLNSKGLATGYAASLSKHELAKQIIYHAASWKPTKLGYISQEKQIDAALAVAWRSIVKGTWQMPLDLAKAQILQYEFNSYKQKYYETGIMSYELNSLEASVSKLLGSRHLNLAEEIRQSKPPAERFISLATESENNNQINGSNESNYHSLPALNLDYPEKEFNNYVNIIEHKRRAGEEAELEVEAGGSLVVNDKSSLTLPSYHQEQEYHLGYNDSCRANSDDVPIQEGNRKNYRLGNIRSNREYAGNEDNKVIAANTANIIDDIGQVIMTETPSFINQNDNQYCNQNDSKSQFNGMQLKEIISDNPQTFDVNSAMIINLSEIPEKQKYVKMVASDKDGEMIIKTVNDGEYLFKLSSMQQSNDGDLVMTFKHADLNAFITDISTMAIKP